MTILGITDSARVALGIFLLHLATLTLFVIWVIVSANLITHWLANLSLLRQDVYWPKALFLGFSAAMLGVSGFRVLRQLRRAAAPRGFSPDLA